MRGITEKGKYNSALQAAAAKQNPTALKVAMMKMKLHSEVCRKCKLCIPPSNKRL